jgi:hypothetical protein
MKHYVQFLLSQAVEIWILFTALGIVFIPNFATPYSLHDLVWFFMITFFTVLLVASLLSKSKSAIFFSIILIVLGFLVLYASELYDNAAIHEVFSLPISNTELSVVFLLTLCAHFVYHKINPRSHNGHTNPITRSLALRLFSFIFPILGLFAVGAVIDPTGAQFTELFLLFVAPGAPLTYLALETYFLTQDIKTGKIVT